MVGGEGLVIGGEGVMEAGSVSAVWGVVLISIDVD